MTDVVSLYDARTRVPILSEQGHIATLEVIVGPTQTSLVDQALEVARIRARWPSTQVAPHPHPDSAPEVAALAPLLAEPDALTRLRSGITDERLQRAVDDAPRRVLFDMLEQAWRGRAPGWPSGALSKAAAMETVTRELGEEGRWIKAFRQYTYSSVRRLVLIPTWQCELRCAYCFIPKQDGRVMSIETMDRAIDLLLSTEDEEVQLQFFGGEALLEYERVRHAIATAYERSTRIGKKISFILSSNGWSLDAEKLAWLRGYPVRMELSLDGTAETQRRFRPSRRRGEDSYEASIATNASAIQASGLEHWVIMVVHPTDVDAMPRNFVHIANLGFRRIQINNMLGRAWTRPQQESFARGLHQIGRFMLDEARAGRPVDLVNMGHSPVAMRLNGEVTVDWDGTIYGGNQFLHETEHKDLFVVGHLDDATNIDRYWIDATDNNFLLDWAYKPHITSNNVEVGKIMASFIRWMKGQLGSAGSPEARP